MLVLCPNLEISPDIRLSDNGSCNDMIWETGGLIDASEYDLSNLEFICESLPYGKFPDYAVSDMGCVVVSEKLKQSFESAGIDNIQYFPASVIETEGQLAKKGFYAVNIVGLIDCIDKDASDMDSEENEDGERTIIYSIDKLVLKETDSNPGYLYRMAWFSGVILINENIASKFESSVGIHFIPPERWDGYSGEK